METMVSCPIKAVDLLSNVKAIMSSPITAVAKGHCAYFAYNSYNWIVTNFLHFITIKSQPLRSPLSFTPM